MFRLIVKEFSYYLIDNKMHTDLTFRLFNDEEELIECFQIKEYPVSEKIMDIVHNLAAEYGKKVLVDTEVRNSLGNGCRNIGWICADYD